MLAFANIAFLFFSMFFGKCSFGQIFAISAFFAKLANIFFIVFAKFANFVFFMFLLNFCVL